MFSVYNTKAAGCNTKVNSQILRTNSIIFNNNPSARKTSLSFGIDDGPIP